MSLSLNADPLIIQQIQSHIQILNKQLSTNPLDVNVQELKELLYRIKNDKSTDPRTLKTRTVICLTGAVRQTCRWGSSIGSIVTAGAMIGSLFQDQNTCIPTLTQTVLIAVAATVTAGFTLGNQALDYVQKLRDSKAQLINLRLQATREQLQIEREEVREHEQKERDDEILRLVRRTLKAVEGYQNDKTPERFKEAIKKVNDLPPATHAEDIVSVSREKWLSALIQMSENEFGLKDLLNRVQTIGKDLNTPSEPKPAAVAATEAPADQDADDKPPKRTATKKNVEGTSSPWSEIAGKKRKLTKKYKSAWEKIEDKLRPFAANPENYKLSRLECAGVCYHKTGEITPIEDNTNEPDEHLLSSSHISVDDEDSSPRFSKRPENAADFV